jgi:hypothetical protein
MTHIGRRMVPTSTITRRMDAQDARRSAAQRAIRDRREPPAVCYTCGADVPETPRFGNEATCDDCMRNGRVRR